MYMYHVHVHPVYRYGYQAKDSCIIMPTHALVAQLVEQSH